jgi:hypothetical protein
MSGRFTHNPRLPLPADVLPLTPYALMIDGVEAVEVDRAVGFWTPREDQCQVLVENGTPLVNILRVPEAFNQLASYTIMHGHRSSRLPFLTGFDQIRAKQPIALGELVSVAVTGVGVSQERIYWAKGLLLSQLGDVAYSGMIKGVLLEEGETWEDPEPKTRAGTVEQPHPKHPETRFQELYQQIVRIGRIPQVTARPNAPKINMSIESDHDLKINDEVIRLFGHKLFVLNALLLNLGREITRTEVEEMGFAEGAKKGSRQVAFSQAKRQLEDELVSGDPPRSLIRQRFSTGKRGYYQLDPRFEYVFADRRPQPMN